MTNEDRRRVVAEIGEALPMTARHLVSMFEELERENAELMEINQKLNDQIKVTNRNAAELVDKNAELERENERLRSKIADCIFEWDKSAVLLRSQHREPEASWIEGCLSKIKRILNP